ncbi:MAG: hypothetical protein HN348_04000 [Proteobacteria bacterium]|jgi:hypothetical protein|nr:hypothetical protein [Pseudomonadota bacterium]
MTKVLLIVDGERDVWMLPAIVATHLGRPIKPKVLTWKSPELRIRGTGFGRKLKLAIRIAEDEENNGLIAFVDHDRSKRPRRVELNKARQESRDQGYGKGPIAIGEAIPHGEAWLLDAHTAVQTVLGLGADAKIPDVKKDAKQPLDSLLRTHWEGTRQEAFEQIAQLVDVAKTRRSKDTGLKPFIDDLIREFESRT